MPKSKDAFRTISEVAEWLETPAHVLRFWESKFTQVKPVKRAGGRRYYRPADMQLLGGIKKLLHDDGLTIKGAQKLLREHGVKHVAGLSQTLEDDLLDDESIVAEAAYEPDAQPEPLVDEPARVLTFPSRDTTTESKPDTSAPVDTEESRSADDAPATPEAAVDVPVDAPATVHDTTDSQGLTADPTPDRSGDSPAFGSDALPAFLRRSPPPTAPTEDAAEDQTAVTSEPEAASPQPEHNEVAEKVTINPTAHFEPVDGGDDLEAESAGDDNIEQATHTEASAPQQPMFSHRATSQEDAGAEPAAPAQSTETEQPSESPTTPVAAPAIDVPSVAKIAPPLESYDAEAGILAALPGARRISSTLASELAAQLKDLRALRDRMQSH